MQNAEEYGCQRIIVAVRQDDVQRRACTVSKDISVRLCVLKCAGKGRRSAECIVEGFKPGEKALNLNAMLDRMQDNEDNEMDPDSNLGMRKIRRSFEKAAR